ncbi:HEAT repeat-containing protein 1 [Myotis davidii]|uniref:HEAT repeat-containing protein 1 n=1 Tax=Myotis davidii TaxID=225400 RepID=L5M0C6_MYODS|nr:HEAT repeat-containing protein 1 [Myotis davidii]
MTSLAQQLQRLALPQSDPSLLSRDEVASLLFDPKEAATLDRDTAFAIGCTGLEELLGIDPAFEQFEAPLFSQLAKTLARSVQTKAVNKQLDENISLFLTHLGGLKPAHKCLEWLIHRFHIHLYNQDSLIACVLPYHETRIFVRVIQLLKINNPKHKWFWLLPVKQSGVPLAKGTLITHCYKDLGFMDFICSLVTKSVKVFAEYPGNSAQLRVLLTFYASTIVSALVTAENISDNIVAKLFPYVQKGLKSSLPDYRAATYMIICQISVKVTMEDTIVNSLASQIIKTLTKTPSLIKEGLGCLIVLLQRQKPESLGKKPFPHLCNVPDLITTLHGISETYDISPLLRYMLPHLVVSIINHVTGEETEGMDGQIYRKHLEAILTHISLKNNLDHLLASLLFEEYISYNSQEEIDPNKASLLNEQFLPLIRLLESKYPRTLDVVLEEHLKQITDLKKQELFHQFISLSTSGGKYQFLADSNTSLMLSLNHPLAPVRLLAVNHLKNIMKTSKESIDESFITEAILTRLGDDSIDVVLSAISAFEIFKSHFSPEVTVSNLLNLFQRAELSKNRAWYEVLEAAADILIKEEMLSGNDELANQVVVHLLPFMVIDSDDLESAETKLAIYLSKSGICSLHPVLRGWKAALENVIKSTKSGKLIGIANQKMIELLADNINSEDPSSVLKLVEDLISVAEKECFSLKQKVTFHVVTGVLVSCCSSSKGTHFPFAIRAFSLLQKKVKKLESAMTAVEVPPEWHAELVLDRGMPVQLWAHYIQQVRTAQRIAVEDSVLLLFSLKNFIHALKAPKSFPKGGVWWNPDHLEEDGRDYLRLLIGLFEIILSGADSTHFRVLMKVFMKEVPPEWHAELVLDRGMPVQLWAHYIQQVRTAQRIAVEDSVLLLFSLKNFIHALKAPKSFPKGGVWWNPDHLEEDGRDYLRLLIGLFEIILGGADSTHFRVLMKVFMKVHLEDVSQLFKFLSVVWTYGSSLSNPLSCRVKAALQTQALYMGCAVLTSQKPQSKAQLSSMSSPVVASLLLNLGSPIKEVRRAAIHCLQALGGVASQFHLVIEHVTPKAEEVTSDASYVIQDLATLFEELQREKKLKSHQKLSETLKNLLYCVSSCPSYVAKDLLKVLQGVNSEMVLAQLLPMAEQLLEKSHKEPSAVLKDEATVLHLILGKYNEYSASLLHKDPKSLDIFVKAVHTTEELFTGMPSVQITALEKLLPMAEQLLEKSHKEPSAVLKDEATVLHLILGKYNEYSASLLHKDPKSLDIFIKAVHTTEELFTGVPSFQITALEKITKPFFAAISDEKVQQKLLCTLFDLLVNCKNSHCAQTVSSVFKGISVNAEQVRIELEPPDKTKSLGTIQQTRRQKMQQKKSQDLESVQDIGGSYWQRVTLILELLQHKKKLKNPQILIPTLFNLLSRCLEPLPLEQGSMEYTKQLILSCLLNICQKLSPDGGKIPKDVLDEEKFNVELIVQCIRVSEMPQTHHHALLLLGTVAGIFPDKVLHNIMSIFTFMGANVMRLDDTYSFQVINKTVKMVIPALIQSDGGDSVEVTRNVEAIVVKITGVFVDALPHVPEHRRLPVLVQLVDTLGAARFLWVLLVLLFEQYITKTALAAACGEKDAMLEADTEFWISVCCEFSVQEQIQSLMNILQYLLRLPEEKEETVPKVASPPSEAAGELLQVFSVDAHTAKQLRHFKFLSVSFMAQLLASSHFIRKVVESGGPQALKGLEQRLLEAVLGYINAVAQSVEKNADKLTGKFWRALLSKAYDMLDKVNALLPTETFIPVISGLLGNPLPSVRRKAMDLLNNKLQQKASWKKKTVSDSASNPLTALRCQSCLCLPYGSHGTVHIRRLLSGYTAVARVLMPSLLTTMKNTSDLVSGDVYLLSALAALQKVVETLPHFLSPYLEGVLAQNDLEEVGKTENHIIDCLVAMVVKLSEVTFRPLFFKLFDWAKTEDAPKDRLLTFYNLADCIAAKLKGLFTLFAGHLVKPFADTLNQVNISKTDEAFFDSENDPEKCCLLLQFILNCLHKIFLFDTQHFLSKERAEALMMPLVDQVIHLEKITSEMGAASQANVRLASLKKTLATTLSPRVLLPAINKTYKHTQKDWRNHMGPFMSILQEHIGVMKKEELTSHQSQLTTFFLEALDFRARHPENDLEEVGKTENHIIDCLVAMVVKLSEVTFRPLFFKLFDWAKTEDAPKDRLLTFYNLADCIAAKLKGLFTLFAGHLVKPFADTLNQVNISKTDEAFFDSENDPEKCCLLLQFILNCLHKIFLFDTQHFLSKERAEALMMPLVDQNDLEEVGKTENHIIDCLVAMVVKLSEVTFRPLFFKLFDWAKTEDAPKDRLLTFYNLADCIAAKLKGLFTLFAGHLVKPFADTLNQLENRLGGEERFQERVTRHLVPCIAQFSVAMADDSLWKPLNVRFAALITVLALAETLKENYIVLLPESIPFLAELMEDECEEVEHQCQRTVQQLEAVLGEPLQSYF